jgi:hypothetical protein
MQRIFSQAMDRIRDRVIVSLAMTTSLLSWLSCVNIALCSQTRVFPCAEDRCSVATSSRLSQASIAQELRWLSSVHLFNLVREVMFYSAHPCS